MATGKTNSRFIRVFMDDSGGSARDISASVSNVSSVGLTYGETNVTAYSDGVVNFTLGTPTADVELSGPFNNTASTGSHTVFSGINGLMTATYTLTVEIGIRAVPTTGDPSFGGEYYCANYRVNGDGTWTARLVPASATAPAWGTKA